MKKTLIFLSIVLLAGLLLFGGFTLAKADGGYLLTSSVIAGGGSSPSNGGYQLGGTSGQAEAGHDFTNGAYTFHGGFWYMQPAGSHKIYLPRVVK